MYEDWNRFVARKLSEGVTELKMLIVIGKDKVALGKKTRSELISEIEEKVLQLDRSSVPYTPETMNWRDEI